METWVVETTRTVKLTRQPVTSHSSNWPLHLPDEISRHLTWHDDLVPITSEEENHSRWDAEAVEIQAEKKPLPRPVRDVCTSRGERESTVSSFRGTDQSRNARQMHRPAHRPATTESPSDRTKRIDQRPCVRGADHSSTTFSFLRNM